MTLVEFLLARIAEDEAIAREAATQGDLHEGIYLECLSQQITDHAVRWSPVRALAECDAKRRIIETYIEAQTMRDAGDGFQQYATFASVVIALWPLVVALAAVYADHPDYDETWRP